MQWWNNSIEVKQIEVKKKKKKKKKSFHVQKQIEALWKYGNTLRVYQANIPMYHHNDLNGLNSAGNPASFIPPTD